MNTYWRGNQFRPALLNPITMKSIIHGLLWASLLPCAALADVDVTIPPSDGTGISNSFDGHYDEYDKIGTDRKAYNGAFINDSGSRRFNRVRRYEDASNFRHHLALIKFDLSATGLVPEDLIGAFLTNTSRGTENSAARTKGSSTFAVGIYTGNDDDIVTDAADADPMLNRYMASNPLIDDAYPEGGDGSPDTNFATMPDAVEKLVEFTNLTPVAGEANEDVIGAGDPGFLDAVKEALDPGGDQAITFLIYTEGLDNSAEYYFYSSEDPDGRGPRLTLETIPDPFFAVDPDEAFPGEELTMTWYAPPGSTNVTITPDIGDVSGDMDEFGRGSRAVIAPETNTTYTLSYDFDGSTVTFMDDIVVETSLFESVVVTNNMSDFEQVSDFKLGDLAFTDRDYTWTDLPDMVLGGQAIRFGMQDRDNGDFSAALTALSDSTLFLFIDNRVGDPLNLLGTDVPTIGGGIMDWVVDAGFIDTGIDGTIESGSSNTPCSIFFVQVAAGETVTLLDQGDGTSRLMYTPVLVSPSVMPTGFGAAPNVLVEFSSTEFSWAVPPGSTNISITPDVGDVTADTDAVTGIGRVNHEPQGNGGFQYTLSYDPLGEATVTVSIDVNVEELDFDFVISPEIGREGDPITFTWQIPPGSTGVAITPDVGDVTSDTNEDTGVGSVVINAPAEDTDYELVFTYDGFEDFLDAFFEVIEEPPVFSSVVASGNSKPVTINPEAFFDGTEIYNDRGFFWVDVPELLEGAELLKFGNDDKNNGSFSVDVTARDDTTIFLMIDNRVGDDVGGADNPPTLGGGVMDWVLSKGFVDTGLDVADDEGTPTIFSIFFLQVAAEETVTFSEQANGGSRILYNIAGVSPQVSPPTPFLASPGVIDLGEPVSLQWTVPAGSDIVSIDQGVGDVTGITDGGTGAGNTNDTPLAPGAIIYTLTYTEGEGEDALSSALRAYVTVNDTGGPTPAPPISDIIFDPVTGEVSFSWPAPDGVTDPGALTDTVERSTNLADGWEAVPGAIITITDGVVTLKDPSPPEGKAFYRVNRP